MSVYGVGLSKYSHSLRAGLFLFLLTCLCLTLHTGTVHALTSTWASSSSGSWGQASNWTPSGVPSSNVTDVVLPDYGPSLTNINVGGTYFVEDLDFTAVNSTYMLFGSGQLYLYRSLNVADNNTNSEIDMPLVLQNDTTFNIGSGSSITLSGTNVLSGAHGLTITGGGSVDNNGTENYTGPTTITDGYFGSSGGDQFAPASDFTLANNSDAILSACGGDQIIGSLSGGSASQVQLCGARITLGNSSNTTYAGTIADVGNGGGGITKVGTGTFTLTGTNTFTGPTIVNAGTLDVNGALTNSALTVNSAGMLKGSGTLHSATINGIVAPGNSIGTLNTTSLTLASGSTLENEINPSGGTDLINASTSVTINTGSTLNVLPTTGTYTTGQTYTIISAPSITGTFSSITSSSNALTYQLKYYPTHIDLVVLNASDPVVSPTSSGTTTTTPTAPSTGFGEPRTTNMLENVLVAVSLLSISAGFTVLYTRGKHPNIS